MVPKVRIADFVHGKDGLGDTSPSPPKKRASDLSAKDFLVKTASCHPGEVTVVALGPLTNIALVWQTDDSDLMIITSNMSQRFVSGVSCKEFFVPYTFIFVCNMQAIEADPMFAKNVKQIVVLGGAFFVNGNVNPAAEANVNTTLSTYLILRFLFQCMTKKLVATHTKGTV